MGRDGWQGKTHRKDGHQDGGIQSHHEGHGGERQHHRPFLSSRTPLPFVVLLLFPVAEFQLVVVVVRPAELMEPRQPGFLFPFADHLCRVHHGHVAVVERLLGRRNKENRKNECDACGTTCRRTAGGKDGKGRKASTPASTFRGDRGRMPYRLASEGIKCDIQRKV